MGSRAAAAAGVVVLSVSVFGCSGSSSHSGGPSSGTTQAASTEVVWPGTVSAAGTAGLTPSEAATVARVASASTLIDHVFIIFKENHTFDNYFGTYPGANGKMTAVDSTGATVDLTFPWIDIDDPGDN